MKILITGATGLVGSALVALCRKEGIAVHYLTTNAEKLVVEPGYHGFYWNPSKGEIDPSCMEGVTTIINLAGASISKRWSSKYKRKVLRSRIESLRCLHSVLAKQGKGPEILISASAIGVYPDSLTNYYDESEPSVDPGFLGEVVSAWEQEATTFNSLGIRVAMLRIGLVMSVKGGALPEMARPIKYGLGAAFGSGLQWQSWIHVNDLARMFLFLATNGLEGIYNGVAPNPVTNKKLIRAIANALKRPLILPNVPRFVMQAVLGEMSTILFASQRVSSKKIEEEGFIFEHGNISSALEHLLLPQDTSQNPDPLVQNKFV